MLVRCLYASRVAGHLSGAALDEILAQSRANNPARGITGLLCHANEYFVQVVEGGRAPVSALLCAIYADKRHCDVTPMLFEEISERRFGNWTMGRINLDGINPALVLRHSESAELDPFAISGRAMLTLIEELIASGKIATRTAG